MADEDLCYGVPKPKFPPSYYAAHDITPSPDNDWVCRVSGWEWQQTAEEKVQTALAEKESEDRPFTPATRDMYSRIVVDGVKYHVYTDTQGRDYFQKGNDMCYLLSTWWVTYEGRQHGEDFIKECTPWKTSGVGVFEDSGKVSSEPKPGPGVSGDCPRGRQYQAPLMGDCDPGYYREKNWGRDMCVCEKGAAAETGFDKLGDFFSGNLKMVLIVVVILVLGIVVIKITSKKVSVG